MTTRGQGTFWQHVEELRKTVIRMVLIAAGGVLLSLFFHSQIFELLTSPLSGLALENYEKKLVILAPTDGISIVLKTAFWIGVVGTSPLWLFVAMLFVVPALEVKEKRFFAIFLPCSFLFLLLGLAFAYFFTIPLSNRYLESFNRGFGVNLWSLSAYLNYTLFLMLANALAFELFCVLLFLIHCGKISANFLKEKRKAAVIAIFILSAILTPPDVFTQIALAIPLLLLYEGGILYAKI